MPRSSTSPRDSDAAVSARMRRVGREDTAVEIALRRALFKRGLRYRKNYHPVAGLRTRADIVFVRPRVAVYVDGCFWHGCPAHATWPKTNVRFWREKIEANIARDRRIDTELERTGWEVVRVWAHEDPEEAADYIEVKVRRSHRP